MTPDEVRAWVERSRRAQGLPLKVTDAATIARLAVLFGAPPERPRTPAKPPAGQTDAPPDPGVQRGASGDPTPF